MRAEAGGAGPTALGRVRCNLVDGMGPGTAGGVAFLAALSRRISPVPVPLPVIVDLESLSREVKGLRPQSVVHQLAASELVESVE